MSGKAEKLGKPFTDLASALAEFRLSANSFDLPASGGSVSDEPRQYGLGQLVDVGSRSTFICIVVNRSDRLTNRGYRGFGQRLLQCYRSGRAAILRHAIDDSHHAVFDAKHVVISAWRAASIDRQGLLKNIELAYQGIRATNIDRRVVIQLPAQPDIAIAYMVTK